MPVHQDYRSLETALLGQVPRLGAPVVERARACVLAIAERLVPDDAGRAADDVLRSLGLPASPLHTRHDGADATGAGVSPRPRRT